MHNRARARAVGILTLPFHMIILFTLVCGWFTVCGLWFVHHNRNDCCEPYAFRCSCAPHDHQIGMFLVTIKERRRFFQSTTCRRCPMLNLAIFRISTRPLTFSFHDKKEDKD